MRRFALIRELVGKSSIRRFLDTELGLSERAAIGTGYSARLAGLSGTRKSEQVESLNQLA